MPEVSIIIPCYQEETHLELSVSELIFNLNNFKFDYELLFIDDGSTDGTKLILEKIKNNFPHVKVFYNSYNIGRGASVEIGIRESDAKVVGFLDIDLSTPPVNIGPLIQLIQSDFVDVAIAFRVYKLKLSVLPFIIHRVILSYGYRILSRNYLGHKFRDTETGTKFFNRKKILSIIDQIEDKHWFWDTEVMLLSAIKGLKIVEIPAVYIRRPCKPSTVKIFKDVISYFRNLWKFRLRLRKHLSQKKVLLHPINYELIINMIKKEQFNGETSKK